MAFTVADALELTSLKLGDARVLTGDDGLDRDVRWVHSAEIADIAQFLRGGELLLTAGLGIGFSDEEQRSYVRGIANAGAAALVIEESGRAFDKVPDTVVDEGLRCGLPVVALTHEVAFAAVSAEVHDILTEQQLRALRREREIEMIFSDLLLEGGDHVSIVQKLAELTGSTVVVEDASHRVAVCEVVGDGSFDVSTWEQHARVLHGAHTQCVRRAVLMRGQLWGYIHVLEGQAPEIDFTTAFVAERAATAIAIALLTDRSREAVDDQRSTALLTHLMLGEINGEMFVEQAGRLGYQLGRDEIFVVVTNKATELDPAIIQTRSAFNPQAISADMGDYLITVAPRRARQQVEKAVRADQRFRSAGTSRNVASAMIALAVRQAKSAAAVARTSTDLLHFDDLGVERILVSLAEGPELAAFVDDELGPLLKADEAAHTPLLPTLRAFLQADGRKTDAADALFIQRRTLYNRLERMAVILGRSLDDPETRQRLLLAVRGLDLLGGQTSHPV
ncbi:PucR family transcriptional regulator [soil metagenome]